MEKNFEKGELLSRVEAFANEMSEMTKQQNGVKRGVIILAAETVESENGTKQILSVLGNGEKLVELIAEFATQEKTKTLLADGMKAAAIKELIKNLRGGGIILKININK